jgi:hypothetical protein
MGYEEFMVPIARKPHGFRVARSWASKRKERKKDGARGLIWIAAVTLRATYHEDVMDAPGRSHVQPKIGPHNTQLHCDPIEISARNWPTMFQNHISRRMVDTNIEESNANVESRAVLANNNKSGYLR